MRKIIITALVAIAVAAAGCSKKTEERAEEGMSTPAPMEKAAPESAPMDDTGMGDQAEPAPATGGGMEPMQEEQAPMSSDENN